MYTPKPALSTSIINETISWSLYSTFENLIIKKNMLKCQREMYFN